MVTPVLPVMHAQEYMSEVVTGKDSGGGAAGTPIHVMPYMMGDDEKGILIINMKAGALCYCAALLLCCPAAVLLCCSAVLLPVCCGAAVMWCHYACCGAVVLCALCCCVRCACCCAA